MADIYLSCVQQDRELAQELAAFLRAQGYTVFVVLDDITPGMDFREVVAKEITVSKAVIVLWSEASAQNAWVHQAAFTALRHSKLIPVLVRGANSNVIPNPFSNVAVGTLDDKSTILKAISELYRRPQKAFLFDGPLFALAGFAGTTINTALTLDHMAHFASRSPNTPLRLVDDAKSLQVFEEERAQIKLPEQDYTPLEEIGAVRRERLGRLGRLRRETDEIEPTVAPPTAERPLAPRHNRFAFVLLATAVAAAAALTVTQMLKAPDWLDAIAGLLGLKQNAIPAFGLFGGRRDEVECSVFSPPAAPPGSTILVQVFFHMEDQQGRAHAQAALMDASTSLRGHQPLEINIKRKSPVTISLSGTGIEIEEPQVTVRWLGQPTFAQFEVRLPDNCDGRNIILTARVSVNGGLVGCIKFSVLASAQATAPRSVAIGAGRRYSHAFLSYATPDRAEVLKRAQILQATGVSFFQDILTLDPGDRWQPKIWEHLDRCDLFLLFWSKAAISRTSDRIGERHWGCP